MNLESKQMFRFIHTADIHLDSPLKGLEVYEDAPAQEIRGATRRAFDKLIELAIAEEVDFILIAGDLYDGNWKDYNTGLFFVGRMGRLARKGIKVFIVSGNHDAASQITKSMPLPDNVVILSSRQPQTVRLDDLSVAIHGQSYQKRAVTDNLASHYPPKDPNYFNIGLLHTALNGREGHEPYAPCSVDDLVSKGYDYWALGHVHQREVVCQDPFIIFTGNIQGRHIRETGIKGATLVAVEDGRVTEVEHRQLDVLRWAVCLVDLATCETIDQVYEVVHQAFGQELDLAAGNTLAVRLVLTGKCAVHSHLLENTARCTEEFRGIAAGLGNAWLEKVKFQTSRKVDLREVIGEDTPMVGLLQSVQNLALDGDSLAELVPELAKLRSKLPGEIYDGSEPFLETSSSYIEELCVDVQELLIAKLLQHGGDK